MENSSHEYQKKPDWLRIKLPRADEYGYMKEVSGKRSLHTICESGLCPNKAECWGAGTATFMILGDICTRNCRFCNVQSGRPLPPDPKEPQRVADAIRSMGVKHCVITSVDRDDLPDGGASVWAETIRAVKAASPGTTIETLIPDFKGDTKSIQLITEAGPEVISHNLETVRRLTPEVRSAAHYDRSLELLRYISSQTNIRTKSGIMLGLGETEQEILETMDDLLAVNCQVITIGQYLQPSRMHLPVQQYVHPDDFHRYGEIARQKGFLFIESAPLVRSSYHAERHVQDGETEGLRD